MNISRIVLWLFLLSLVIALPGQTAEGPTGIAANTPVIAGLSPKHIKAGSRGFTLTVKGRHFGRSSVVLCNGSPMPTDWEGYRELEADIPASELLKPGKLSITVQNRGMLSNSENLSVTDPASAQPHTQPVEITTSRLSSGQVGVAYHASLAATGGQQPYHWSLASGGLPGGVSLSDSGQLSGSPTTKGDFPITIHVQDSSSPSSSNSRSSSGDSKALTISIAATPHSPSPLLITTTSLPSGQQGSAYPTSSLAAVGGTPPYHWSVISGALPNGLLLSDGGPLSGTPKANGNFPAIFQVRDSTSPVSLTGAKQLTISVTPAPPAPSPLLITSTSLPSGQQGSAYPTSSLAAVGGMPPYHWSVISGALPNGLLLSDGGQLSGTPMANGNFPAIFQVKDSTSPTALTDSKQLTINIAATPPTLSPVKITTTSLPNGQVGTAYPATPLAASGGTQPYKWSLASSSGPLPDGLSLTSGGQISGSPTRAGAFLMTFQVQDSAQPTASTDSATLSINIAPNQPPSSGSDTAAIFFSDLLSGPNTGGQNNKGVFVTLYGKGFGAAQGSSTVTLGGGLVDNCPLWTDTQVACQIGPAAQTGSIVVTVNGAASNGLPFTLRSGKIFFTAASGSDSNDGSFPRPFATIKHGKDALGPGDTLYVMDGVVETGTDNFGATINIQKKCGPSTPCALLAYPGAQVTIGSTSGAQYGIRQPDFTPSPSTDFGDWVFAGFHLRGSCFGIEISNSSNVRIVGNDISSPGNHCAGIHVQNGQFIKTFGNRTHDSGQNVTGTKFYHMIYYTSDSNHAEVAWNEVDGRNSNICRGIQFHSSPANTPGFNQYDLSVHDNYIHDTRCDGLNFATVDPSKGKVEAYNNLIVHTGLGVLTGDQSNFSCIYFAGITNAGSPGTGTAHLYNNTLVDCGPQGGSDSGAIGFDDPAATMQVQMDNNLISLLAGEHYFNPNSHTVATHFSGSSNLFFGLGAGPSFLSGNVNADPKFVNAGAHNFRLLAGSPAIDAGSSTGLATDFDGVPRPQGAAYDIGAFEFAGASTTQQPNPPTNLRVVTVK